MTAAQINRQQGWQDASEEFTHKCNLPQDFAVSLSTDYPQGSLGYEYWKGYADALAGRPSPYARINVGLAVPWYRNPLKALLQWWDEKLGEVMP